MDVSILHPGLEGRRTTTDERILLQLLEVNVMRVLCTKPDMQSSLTPGIPNS